MGEKNQQEQKDYQFIREKVIAKKKNRVGRLLCLTIGVLCAAILFGIVARIAFLLSDGPIRKILGLENETEQVEEIPTPTLAPTPPPTPTPTQKPSATPAPTPTESVVPQVSPVVPEDVTVVPTAVVTPSATPTPSISPQELYLGYYTEIHEALNTLAKETERGIVRIETAKSSPSWLDDTYEIQNETIGLILEKLPQKLMILVYQDRMEEADRFRVMISGEAYEATLWNSAPVYNLAVLCADISGMPPETKQQLEEVKFGDSDTLSVGTPVMALGSPNSFYGSREFGVVNGTDQISYVMDNSVMQFYTTIPYRTQGDYVIFNLEGEVVGLSGRTLRDGIPENVDSAIAVNEISDIIDCIRFDRNYVILGIIGKNIPRDILTENEIESGIYVEDVLSGSPAYEAGVKAGDILVSINDIPVANYRNLHTRLRGYLAGESVKISVIRTVRMTPKKIDLDVVFQSR